MHEQDNIDDRLKQLLNELTVQPEPASFDAVIRKMERKKRRRFIVFFWLGLGLISGSLWFYSKWPGVGQKNNMAANITAAPVLVKSLKDKGLQEPPAKNNKIYKQSIKEGEEEVAQVPDQPVFLKDSMPSRPKRSVSFIADSAGTITETANTGLESLAVVFDDRTEHLKNDTAQAKTGDDALKIDEEEPFVFLQSAKIYLNDSASYALMPAPVYTRSLTFFGGGDSLRRQARRIRIYLGLGFTPQVGSFLYLKNPRRNQAYDKANPDFPKIYYHDKKKNNRFYEDYAYGLKAGIVLHDAYELFVGFGFQRYHEFEKANKASPPTNTLDPTQNGYFPQLSADGSAYLHTYRYRYYSAEASRIFKTRSFYKWKLGGGVQLNQLRYDVYNRPGLSAMFCTLHFKTGVMANAGKRLQFQLCPALFCAPASMFTKNYVIRQNPYGLQLEALLLFRLF